MLYFKRVKIQLNPSKPNQQPTTRNRQGCCPTDFKPNLFTLCTLQAFAPETALTGSMECQPTLAVLVPLPCRIAGSLIRVLTPVGCEMLYAPEPPPGWTLQLLLRPISKGAGKVKSLVTPTTPSSAIQHGSILTQFKRICKG